MNQRPYDVHTAVTPLNFAAAGRADRRREGAAWRMLVSLRDIIVVPTIAVGRCHPPAAARPADGVRLPVGRREQLLDVLQVGDDLSSHEAAHPVKGRHSPVKRAERVAGGGANSFPSAPQRGGNRGHFSLKARNGSDQRKSVWK
jgi:hypothetical protein